MGTPLLLNTQKVSYKCFYATFNTLIPITSNNINSTSNFSNSTDSKIKKLFEWKIELS